MALELTKHPNNRMFMTFGGGTATNEKGWTVNFSANIQGSGMVMTVYDDKKNHLAVFTLDAEALCQEALRLSEEEVSHD